MKGWRKAVFWIGAVSLLISIAVIAVGMGLARSDYSPANFHDPHWVIIWPYFAALWLFWPSLFVFALGGILMHPSRTAKQKSK